MGEDTCVYVNKKDLKGLYFTALAISHNFGNRWRWFKEKYDLGEYPNKGYFNPKDILLEIAGKKIKEDHVTIIKDLIDTDCIIQGDYTDFPKGKKEEDYVDLTTIFYYLWDDMENEMGKNSSHIPK